MPTVQGGLFRRWQASPWLAHIVPLAAFLLLQSLTGFLRLHDGAGSSWWRSHPEHWVYPLQTVLCAMLLACWWRHYEFTPLRPAHAALAGLLAAPAITPWILPHAFGWVHRPGGFDPYALGNDPRLFLPILAFRFLRLVLVAAFVEEIFWRGFLQRYLVDTRADFWKIPMGTFTWSSAAWTTLGVVLIHGMHDWPAAAIWGILMTILYVRTRSLTACVFLHAVSNLALGIYVVSTRGWALW